MTDERLQIWLGFAKFVLGTVIVGLVTTYVNHQIQEREIELKETEQLGKFVEHALNENIALRKLFAQYFATVTRSNQLRERWVEYSSLVEKEFLEVKKEKERVKKALSEPQESAVERTRLIEQLRLLENDLDFVKRQSAVSKKTDAEIRGSQAVAFSPNGQVFASIERDEGVVLTNSSTGKN